MRKEKCNEEPSEHKHKSGFSPWKKQESPNISLKNNSTGATQLASLVGSVPPNDNCWNGITVKTNANTSTNMSQQMY